MRGLARAFVDVYVRSVLSPVERLTRLVGKPHLFDDSMSSFRERKVLDNRMVFDASHPRLLFRATHFAEQEPDLLRWIDTKYRAGEIFFDVGANIGYFSIYAALNRDVRVYAFEPESLTFASLNRNIFYNHLSDKITALALALSSAESLSFLNLRDFLPGNAYNTFGAPIDFRGEPFEAEFRQGSLGMTMDYLIDRFGLRPPNHLKIDVDGNEAEIIQGMTKTLAAKELRTVCIELTPSREDHRKVIERLAGHGFVEDLRFLNTERDSVGTRNFYFERA